MNGEHNMENQDPLNDSRPMEIEEEELNNPDNFPAAPPPLIRQNAQINHPPNPRDPNLGRFDAFDQPEEEEMDIEDDEVDQALIRPHQ
jgi:hypothetical protein